MGTYPYRDIKPVIDAKAVVLPTATICGDVSIGEDSSIWFGAVVRGDMASITIGRSTNIQDNAVVHTSIEYPTRIGDFVTIGHQATIHGCKIEDNALIGMGAIVMDGAMIGRNAMVAAGALVSPGKIVPAGSLAMGMPAKVVRMLTDEEIDNNRQNAEKYKKMAKEYIR